MTKNLITNLAIMGCGLLNAIILARFLGPLERGEVAAVLLWPTLWPYLGATGVIDALVYFAVKPGAACKSAFGSSMVLSTVISAILLPIGYVTLPWFLASQSDEVIQISQLLLVGIPITLYGEMVSSMMRAKLALGVYNTQRLVVPVGYLLATMILYLSGHLTMWTIACTQLSLWAVRLLISLVLCRYSHIDLTFSWNSTLTKEMLSFSAKSHVGAMAERASSQLDQIIVAAWLSPVSLGYYVAAKSITSLISTVPLAIKISILPRLAAEIDKSHQIALISKITGIYWLYAFMIAPPFALCLFWLIPLVYGSEFEAAVKPAMILLFGAVFFGAKDILGVASKAIGAPLISSVAEIISLAAGGILLIALVASLGMMGAALASFGASFVALMVVAILLNRAFSIPFGQLLPSNVGLKSIGSHFKIVWSRRHNLSSNK